MLLPWLWCQVMPCIICCDVISGTLTHWGRVMHICIVKLTMIGSNNGLSPGRRQAIIWTNARILLIGPLGTNFSEILIGIQTITFKKMHLKMLSAIWRPFCLGLDMLTEWVRHRVGMWGSAFLSSFMGSSCHVRNKIIYCCCDKLFMHSLECYLGVYLIHCFVTQEINIKLP